MKKCILSFILIICLITTILPFEIPTVSSANYFGYCGDGVMWSLTGSGELSIFGEGPMYIEYPYSVPWYKYADKITTVTISSGITAICSAAFQGCTNLTSVTIPDTVISIGATAFERCCSLSTVNIPEGVTSIPFGTFANCRKLTSINIPDSVTYIGGSAFSGCYELASINIPDSVEIIAGDAFGYTAYYDNINNWTNDVLFIGNHLIKAKNTLSGTYTIPGNILTIAGLAFDGCDGLTYVTIPRSVKSIGERAFQNCSRLTSVTVPDGVVSIDDRAFENCGLLSSVSLPTSIISIGNDAFGGTAYYNDSSNWADGFLIIDNHLIEGNRRISGDYTIPQGILTIADYAFQSFEATSLTIPEGVKSIGHAAFSYCTELTSVILPDSIIYIGENAFMRCDSLISVILPKNLTSIERETFFICPKLSYVAIPQSVKRIGEGAFEQCSELTDVYYAGTKEMWDKISVAPNNATLLNANIHFGEVAESSATPFIDIKAGAYYEQAVIWAINQKITNGTSKGKFSPEDPCTRGQIVTFLWRASGSPDPTTTENPFADIATDAYYYKAVLWAVENGITTGTGKGKFSPEATCTRGQVATFLWRAQGKPAPTSSDNPFNDVNSDTYYYNAILWAVEKGVTNGTGKGKFSPDASCTRGQIVTFLYRALN